jgi:hypothetical protein
MGEIFTLISRAPGSTQPGANSRDSLTERPARRYDDKQKRLRPLFQRWKTFLFEGKMNR